MQPSMSAASSSRAFLVFAALLGSAAEAQSWPVVLSIDRYLTHPVTGESRHEILPVAVFDGTRFQAVQESDPVPGEISRVQDLLTQYPVAQVLHFGETIDTVTVSDVHLQGFGCSQFFVGTADYTGRARLPASELRNTTGRRENGERIEYASETFLALSRAIDENDLESGPVISDVTDPEELQSYAAEVDRVAPRPELSPLRIDETRAYEFSGQNAALVVRKRQAAETIALGNSRIASSLYTDAVIVHTGPGQRAAFQVQGFPTERNGLGGGADVEFIDAFALPNGRVYFAFNWWSGNGYFSLYQLGAASETRLVFETMLYGRC